MSAVVCGSKRSFFEELPSSPSTIPISKRIRRCSPPPGSAVQPRLPVPVILDRLSAIFPHMDAQVLERVLEECENDIDAAVKRLHELCLGSVDEFGSTEHSAADIKQDPAVEITDVSAPAADSLPQDGPGWVELFVKEMMSAKSLDDARVRAARALDVLEQSISSRVGVQAAENFQKENMSLKEQIESLIRENTILKRAVAIQYERQKEFDDKSGELQHLKQLVTQYQEQLRTLELNNYALTVHLKQAQQGSSTIPGHFHPDVF